MSDEVKKQFDAFYLFVRTDEKYEEIAAEIHDLRISFENLKNSHDKLDERVNQGVALTGQNNSRGISEHAVQISQLNQRLGLIETKFSDFMSEEQGGRKEIKEAIGVLYKGIVGIFFTLIAGGAILYALKYFKFS